MLTTKTEKVIADALCSPAASQELIAIINDLLARVKALEPVV